MNTWTTKSFRMNLCWFTLFMSNLQPLQLYELQTCEIESGDVAQWDFHIFQIWCLICLRFSLFIIRKYSFPPIIMHSFISHWNSIILGNMKMGCVNCILLILKYVYIRNELSRFEDSILITNISLNIDIKCNLIFFDSGNRICFIWSELRQRAWIKFKLIWQWFPHVGFAWKSLHGL